MKRTQSQTPLPEHARLILTIDPKRNRKPFQFRYPTDQIVRFEGNGNYAWIYAQNKPRELLSIHLKKLGQLYPHFKRVHKSHLINPFFIQQERARTDGYGHPSACLLLADGKRLPWSRRYYQDRYRDETDIHV